MIAPFLPMNNVSSSPEDSPEALTGVDETKTPFAVCNREVSHEPGSNEDISDEVKLTPSLLKVIQPRSLHALVATLQYSRRSGVE